jgi:catechol 2,3-dioxygenase-like lactoylglutathione lyase family enzyme
MIKIEDMSHVAFRAPDLNLMERFLADFGLVTWRKGGRLYVRGLGPAPFIHITEEGEPGFAALGLRADSTADVADLGRAEGQEPQVLQRPCGGVSITLRDPDGYAVEVVAGQTAAAALPLPATAGWNSARDKTRLRTTKRTGRPAAHAVRLGHAVLAVSDFRRSERCYKERFDLMAVQWGPTPPEAV